MSEGNERRRSQRRTVSEVVYVYVDGDRIDTRAANIAMGGLFLRTRRHAELPLGTTVALLFDRETTKPRKMYLLGKISRREADPVPGVAVTLEKAVINGSPQDLAVSLNRLFGLQAAVIEQRVVYETGGERCVYAFNGPAARPVAAAVPVAAPRPASPEPAEARPTAAAPAAPRPAPSRAPIAMSAPVEQPAEPLQEPDTDPSITVVNQPPTSPAMRVVLPPNAPIAPPPRGKRDPMTQPASFESSRAPCRLESEVMTVDGAQDAVITSLGANQAALTMPSALNVRFDDFDMVFSIPAGDRQVRVCARCRLTGIRPCGDPSRIELILEFKRLDEADCPGVLNAYVKWLHLVSMQNS